MPLPLLAAAGIGAGVSALGSITGGLLGSSAAREAARKRQQYLNSQKQENQSWFDRRYNEDATQRADAQRLLQITEDNIRKRNKAIAGREAVMGGATEETAKEKERNNEAMADVVGQIAANNERRKDEIEQQYLNRKQALSDAQNDAEVQFEQQRGQNIANATAGIIGAAGNFALAAGMGGDTTKKTSVNPVKTGCFNY